MLSAASGACHLPNYCRVGTLRCEDPVVTSSTKSLTLGCSPAWCTPWGSGTLNA